MAEREWAGDKKRQAELVTLAICIFENEHPIDVAGAVGTIVANTICDLSKNRADAIDGLKKHYEDMEHVIKARFPDTVGNNSN